MSTTALTVRFDATYARRMPDPTFRNAQRHFMLMPVEELASNLPKDPNPRDQRIDRGIYRDVRSSLLNEDGTPNTFHLKNKGITLFASTVERVDDDVYDIVFDTGDGALDGGHTFEIINNARDEIEALIEADADMRQHVLVQVYSGYPRELIPEIAGGLNTAVQVQDMSLAELKNQFDWIKDAIDDPRLLEQIAFKENQMASVGTSARPARAYDARDVVVTLDCFNIARWPNDGEDHPVRAFQSKAKVLDAYLEDMGSERTYMKLRPIVKDILVLRETISKDALRLHNDAGGKAGKLAFVETRRAGKFNFPLLGEASRAKLTNGALLPMLAAFRWMVVENADREFVWRGSFDDVLDLWERVGAELMKATQATSEDLSRQPNLVGKSRNHWATLHSTVAKRYLMSQFA